MKHIYLFTIAFYCGFLLITTAPTKASAVVRAETKKISAGISLYEEHCADCHRSFQKTNKPQRRLSRLRSSIEQFASMNNLSFLNDEQLEEIAAALATISL